MNAKYEAQGAGSAVCDITITAEMIDPAAREVSDGWGICGFSEAQEIAEVVFRIMVLRSIQLCNESSEDTGGNTAGV